MLLTRCSKGRSTFPAACIAWRAPGLFRVRSPVPAFQVLCSLRRNGCRPSPLSSRSSSPPADCAKAKPGRGKLIFRGAPFEAEAEVLAALRAAELACTGRHRWPQRTALISEPSLSRNVPLRTTSRYQFCKCDGLPLDRLYE